MSPKSVYPSTNPNAIAAESKLRPSRDQEPPPTGMGEEFSIRIGTSWKGSGMRITITRLFLTVLFGLLVLAACGGNEEPTPAPTNTPVAIANTPTSAPPPTPTVAAQVSPLAAGESPLSAPPSPLPTPLSIGEGRSMVTGRLLSLQTNQPLVRAIVRLAEVYCPEGTLEEEKADECFWALDNAFSPSTFSDSDGVFVFEDVEARDYVVIVGDMIVKYAVVNDSEDRPILVAAPPNDLIDVGERVVDY